MDGQENVATSTLQRCLLRSRELEAAMSALLLDDGRYVQWDDSARTSSSCLAAELAFEHWSAVRSLMATDHPRAATALVRMEYEAIVRSAWLLYAASDDEVATMQQELTPDSEKRAGDLPFFGLMLKALETKAPARLYEDLLLIKVNMSRPLNSFVHSGIHALQRGEHGFPLLLVLQVIHISNALGTMSAMMLANLTGNPQKGRRLNEVLPLYRDGLPPLRPVPAGS